MRTVWWIVAVFGPAFALAVFLAGFLAGSPVHAAPDNGFGLGVGLAGHHVEWDRLDGSRHRYDSVGLSLSGDAQFVVTERWSLNPFLMVSLEDSHGDQEQTVNNAIAGFQVRHWSDTYFLAAHGVFHVEILFDSGIARTMYGPGVGVAVGEEPPDALGWWLQFDMLRFSTSEPRLGLRFNLTQRWR